MSNTRADTTKKTVTDANTGKAPRWEDLTIKQKRAFPCECGPHFISHIIHGHVPPHFFREYCCRHDFYYRVGGTWRDRREADRQFFLDSAKHALNEPGLNILQRIWYLLTIIIWYGCVRAFGWLFFHHGKKRSINDIFNHKHP